MSRDEEEIARENVDKDTATLADNPRHSEQQDESEESDAEIPQRMTILPKDDKNVQTLVGFTGKDDPYHPLNWPFRKKVVTTLIYSLNTAGSTFSSAIFASGLKQITREFDISLEVATLSISLMLFGFGLGPMLWAPLSEVFGRKLAVTIPFFIAALFSFATATAKDVQTIMLCRFFAGFFGSAPITNTGGVLGDIWPTEQRAYAIVGYAIAVIGGPTIGPLIGGALIEAEPITGWRWTEYVVGIYSMIVVSLDVLFIDESFSPVLLKHKAQRLRYETSDWSLHAKHEEWNPSLNELANKYLFRPFRLLSTPICFLVALYASFVYGILYANLSAFTIAFQDERGWSPVVGGLPFIAVFFGMILGSIPILINAKYYAKKFKSNGGIAIPEARLPSMMIGGIMFAAGMFIFGWTSFPSLPWTAPVVGCAVVGFGFFTVFQSCLNYLVDVFHPYGASAIAANTFLRSAFAGAFPLFTTPMYRNLGTPWATTIFACFASLLIPIPFLFLIYGKSIRARSVWSKTSDS